MQRHYDFFQNLFMQRHREFRCTVNYCILKFDFIINVKFEIRVKKLQYFTVKKGLNI